MGKRRIRGLLLLTSACVLGAGCGGSDKKHGTEDPICEIGARQDCTCSDGRDSGQDCAEDGSRWLECECDPVGSGGSSASGGVVGSGGTDNTGGAVTGTGGDGSGGDGTGGDGTGGGGTGGSTPGVCGAVQGQLFGSDYPWNQRIDAATTDTESDAIISYLAANHTASQRFRIDGVSDVAGNTYGIVILSADAGTRHEAFTPSANFFVPDCDPAPIPVPTVGAIEGETGYACEGGGDYHLIVVDESTCRLHEMWVADRTSASDFEGGCQAIWDLDAAYTETLRGDCCTSDGEVG